MLNAVQTVSNKLTGVEIHRDQIISILKNTPDNSDTKLLESHITKCNENINFLDRETDKTPLQIAIELKKPRYAALLLKHKAAPNQVNGVDLSALHYCLLANDVETFKLCIKHNADIHVTVRRGNEMLSLFDYLFMWKTQNGHPESAFKQFYDLFNTANVEFLHSKNRHLNDEEIVFFNHTLPQPPPSPIPTDPTLLFSVMDFRDGHERVTPEQQARELFERQEQQHAQRIAAEDTRKRCDEETGALDTDLGQFAMFTPTKEADAALVHESEPEPSFVERFTNALHLNWPSK